VKEGRVREMDEEQLVSSCVIDTRRERGEFGKDVRRGFCGEDLES